MSAAEPRRFGRYELREELGRGGMGVVYRAVAIDGGREVALKIIHAATAIHPSDLKRFEREARFAARVRHPGIVGVIDAGHERGIPYVAFELVRGEPLNRLTLDLRNHVLVLAKVARAVGAAHRSQVVHRDLKPQNVLVDGGTGEPCVVDFGLAFDGRFELSRLSATGEILGTPAYMAPETVEGRADPQDPRLDVYAIGVMLHERLNGGHAFRGLSLHETLERVARGFPSLRGKGVDPDLVRITESALSLDPAKRPADGEALAHALFSWLSGKRLERRDSPRGLVLAASLAGAALALAAAVFLTRSPAATPLAPPPPATPVAPPLAPPRISRRRQRPPAPAHLAAKDVVDEIEAKIDSLSIDPVALQRAQELSAELARDAPEDARTLHFEGLRMFMSEGGEFDGRRRLVLALRASPPLALPAVARSIYFMRQLGFERAAAGFAEEAFPADRGMPSRLAAPLAFLYLTAMPPLADPARAEALATITIESGPDARDRAMRFQNHATRAQARVSLGRFAEAAADFEDAAALAESGPYADAAPFMRERASACSQGQVRPDQGPRAFYMNFAPTSFTGTVEGANQLWRTWSPTGFEDAARAFLELALHEKAQHRNEHAAIATLRAAWALERAHLDERARDALEEAHDLALGAPLDTRALVGRALAHHLLERSLAPARAEKIATDAAFELPPGEPDFRASEELVEAWVLVARARLLEKDRSGAERALEQAETFEPKDRRGIELVRRQLGR